MRKTRNLIIYAISLAFLTFSYAMAEEKKKIGFVYVGPVGDYGWTYQHDKGRQAIVEKFGDKVETSYVESVKEGLIRTGHSPVGRFGHDLIFTTSFGFMNPTIKVAKQFPGVKFESATGYKRADNVATYSSRFYEGRHLLGLIAGKMTKSNIIGYVGSIPIPEVVRGINAFTIALRQVNPKAEVKVVWVNSWYDPGKEADSAKALIDQGADIIVQHTDSPAPTQVAEERGVLSFGQASDMARFGPKAHLTSIIDDWAPYYVERVEALLNGKWQSEDKWRWSRYAGMVVMSPLNPAIPQDVVAIYDKAHKDLLSGKLHAFQGPITDQSGKLVVAKGAVLDDPALLTMDWYVEGVQGKLPK